MYKPEPALLSNPAQRYAIQHARTATAMVKLDGRELQLLSPHMPAASHVHVALGRHYSARWTTENVGVRWTDTIGNLPRFQVDSGGHLWDPRGQRIPFTITYSDRIFCRMGRSVLDELRRTMLSTRAYVFSRFPKDRPWSKSK